MANIPGLPLIPPGFFGLPTVQIRKTEKGYAFSWSHENNKPPFKEGTPKELARDILVIESKRHLLTDGQLALIKTIPIYASIHIEWAPSVNCTFVNSIKTIGFKPIDFLDELTEELKKLSHLLLFV